MLDSGIEKVASGLTTIEEVARVIDISEQLRAREGTEKSDEAEELMPGNKVASFLKDLEKRLFNGD